MQIQIERLAAVHAAVAELTCSNPVYLPVFLRLDAELDAARAASDPVLRARALARIAAA